MNRTLIVGDLHGCSREFRRLLELTQPDRVLLTGDLFTKGPDPVGCWRLIAETNARSVMGNHDAWVLALRDGRIDGSRKPDRMRDLDSLAAEPGAMEWLASLPLFIEEETHLLVHAGLDPWHGRAGTSREQALTLRRWPDDRSECAPCWWELLQPDAASRLVVYGHDARRGFVDNRPRTLGLDSGCVYGGELTGYLLEESRILQVPAFEVYKDVGRHPKRARNSVS